MYHVNLAAVFIGAVVCMGIGMLWYGPFLFGTKWLQLVDLPPMKPAQMKAEAKRGYLVSFLGLMIMGIILSHLVHLLNAHSVDEGIILGFWLSLGFTATVLATTYTFHGRPFQLFLIDAGYQAVCAMSLGGILATWS